MQDISNFYAVPMASVLSLQAIKIARKSELQEKSGKGTVPRKRGWVTAESIGTILCFSNDDVRSKSGEDQANHL